MLLMHGDKDDLVPLQHSEEFVAKCKEVGVEAKLIVKKGERPRLATDRGDLEHVRRLVRFTPAQARPRTTANDSFSLLPLGERGRK